MADNDKIVGKNSTTNSYVNGRGEHLKFTNKSMSIYSSDPRGPHSATHINVDHNKGTFTVNSHNESKSSKSSNSGSCYLTTACMKHFQEKFDDNCYELTVLRWFRDNYVLSEDVKHYYEIAPVIVAGINNEQQCDLIYDYIYDNVVDACVSAIEEGNYEFAYNRYKSSILSFEETFAKPLLEEKVFVKVK